MKTPEEILDEVTAENMVNIQQMVPTKQLAILAMKRYAKLYHESEIKKFNKSEARDIVCLADETILPCSHNRSNRCFHPGRCNYQKNVKQ
jgi:hypothetical protein